MNKAPKHIAIIMDGNRRWAKSRGLTTKIGHKEGAENLKRIARHANRIGIKYLTVYAFSTENWKRNEEEVSSLMILFKAYLNEFAKSANTENIRIKVIGHIETLPKDLQDNVNKAMDRTRDNTGLTLCIAFNYGGRDEIAKATREIARDAVLNKVNIDNINENLISEYLYTKNIPDPDLVIRTSGEIRLSNFLTWQVVYSEFLFVNKYWPEFSEEDLEDAINTYEKRNRNFGGK